MVLSESEDSLRTGNFKNTLLKALDGDIIERLRLQPVKFELKHEIENPGDPIDRLYFLEEGMALRYVQAQLVQAMQSTGCNAKHSFEQRLARWLLI